ncbi:hypothetical protein BJ912DRAFT_920809 [Pholiota molesta]|nr:hypothetical protein BJ912DRAFT_920809 [Pholiota molesta]
MAGMKYLAETCTDSLDIILWHLSGNPAQAAMYSFDALHPGDKRIGWCSSGWGAAACRTYMCLRPPFPQHYGTGGFPPHPFASMAFMLKSPEELAAQIELAAQAELAEQVELIKDLAPSYRAVKGRKDGPMFIGRLFDLWFIRWRLKLQDYGGSEEALEDARVQKKAWIEGALDLAASLLPEGPCPRSPRKVMTVQERRQGFDPNKACAPSIWP